MALEFSDLISRTREQLALLWDKGDQDHRLLVAVRLVGMAFRAAPGTDRPAYRCAGHDSLGSTSQA
jgi:hypothetical protein